jgi:hypothetical protein
MFSSLRIICPIKTCDGINTLRIHPPFGKKTSFSVMFCDLLQSQTVMSATSPRRSRPPRTEEMENGGKQLRSSQALNIRQVIDSCRSNFAKDLKRTFMMDEDAEVSSTRTNGARPSATASLPSTPGAASASPSSKPMSSVGGASFSDENNRRLAARILETCGRATANNETAAAAEGCSATSLIETSGRLPRLSRSRSSLLMIATDTVTSAGSAHVDAKEVGKRKSQTVTSRASYPTERRLRWVVTNLLPSQPR